MAKSTFLQLCQDTARETGDMSSTSITSVTGNVGEKDRVVQWVSYADKEIQGLWFDWDFLHVSTFAANTVIGTAEVAAPSAIGVWDEDSFYLNFSLSTNQKLSPLEYKTWRKSYRQGVQTNKKPSSIVVMPDLSLKLEPKPDAVYSLTGDYWKKPEVMTGNTSTSPIPEEYERIIVVRALMLYAARQSAGEVFSSAETQYIILLDKLESKYLQNQSGRRMSDAGQMTVRVE